jgi:uncharacterized membrane protein (UPF0127 family)
MIRLKKLINIKKIFFYLLVFLILIFFIFYLLFYKRNSNWIFYSIEGKSYKLLIAKTIFEHQKGLMFYRSKKELKGADGMIFIFPDKNYRTFWNKNTFLDLDVYWIDGDRIVGKDFLPSIEKTKEIFTINSPKPVNKVVEIVR